MALIFYLPEILDRQKICQPAMSNEVEDTAILIEARVKDSFGVEIHWDKKGKAGQS